jgi:hypothetical protein
MVALKAMAGKDVKGLGSINDISGSMQSIIRPAF